MEPVEPATQQWSDDDWESVLAAIVADGPLDTAPLDR